MIIRKIYKLLKKKCRHLIWNKLLRKSIFRILLCLRKKLKLINKLRKFYKKKGKYLNRKKLSL